MGNGNRVFLNGDTNEVEFSFEFIDEQGNSVDHNATVQFQRTLRVPDDGKEYPLPAGLGSFPLYHSRSKALTLPEHMTSRGGVVFPIYPFEAAWMNFDCTSGLPVALRIAAGKINAVSGEAWVETTPEIQDYVVLPEQMWLDGFNTGSDQVRQFVAAKLGANLTVEEQLTGEAEWGGIQILAIPMKLAKYQELLNRRRERIFDSFEDDGRIVCCSAPPPASWDEGEFNMCLDMGMGQGGMIKQSIEEDPYGVDDWDFENAQRVFVSMVDAREWRKVGGEYVSTPITPETYEKEGIPWFNLEGISDLPKSASLEGLKTVQSGMIELGVDINDSAPTVGRPLEISPKIADGSW